ncbi:MAG: helix-turn-helix transcriptional regulator [Clostridia bacterium]|nr:helix-turn-helix transcriptional regulator [Clostridia bacterium]
MIVFQNTSFCENLNRIRLNLLNCGYGEVDTTWKGEILNPDYSRLYYVLDGKGYIVRNGTEKTELLPGKWYILPSDMSFYFECPEHLNHVFFHLKLCDLDGMDLLRCLEKPVCLSAASEDAGIFLNFIKTGTLSDGLEIRQKILSLIMKMIKKEGARLKIANLSNCMERAIRYINKNLSMRLSVEEIASVAFVSRSALTKHFKKELGMSVHEYIMDRIMFETGQLLTKGNMSVLTISEKYGFSDQFYFSRCFRSKFGVPPREYKKTAIV